MKDILKPGMETPVSGQYAVVGPRGGKTDVEITSVEGNRLPPTPGIGMGYVLADKTRHKKK